MLSADINLFHRRDEDYSAEKYELDIDIYLFDLCTFFRSMRSIKHIKFRSGLVLKLTRHFCLTFSIHPSIKFKVLFARNISLTPKCNPELRLKILMSLSC